MGHESCGAVGAAVKSGDLAIVPAYYNFASGTVDFLDQAVA